MDEQVYVILHQQAELSLDAFLRARAVWGMVDDPMLSEQDYFARHGVELGFPDPPARGQKPYEFNMNSAQSRLQAGDFMSELIRHLSSLAEEYAGGRPHLLYYPARPSDLTVFTKPYGSALSKVYRLNYLKNRRFPKPPNDAGFVIYEELYSHDAMNDLLRARLVCKYMDGPQFVVSGLQAFCERQAIDFRAYPMNNDKGYYAWHCYMRLPVEIMTGGSVIEMYMWFELQVTTQLAEIITGLTHGLYAEQRSNASRDAEREWRWQPKSQQFRSVYLGHTLHLLEGIIQMFRDEVLALDSEGREQPPETIMPADLSKDALRSTDQESGTRHEADLIGKGMEGKNDKTPGDESS